MARRQITVSDLTGKVIDNPEEVAAIRVLDHPLLEHPVKLDAFLLEVANLEETKRELVTIEVVLPGHGPERMVMELPDFDKLIKVGEPDDVLNSAEPYYEGRQVAEAPRRRGRPRKDSSAPSAPKIKRDPDQLNAMRTWARSNGWPDLGNRGRIPAAAEQAYETAHAS